MNPSHADISAFAAYLDDLQQRITTALTAIDGSPYRLCVPHRHQNTAAVQTVKNWLLAQAGV